MYSLLVGLNDGSVPDGRLFEYTEDDIRDQLSQDTATALHRLPALSLPEIGDDRFEQVARVGTISGFREARWGHRFKFLPNPDLDPIPSSSIQDLAEELHVDPDSWEFTRTHWAVKDVDLFAVLLGHKTRLHRRDSGSFRSSGAVRFPVETPRETDLVAVMMPFDDTFDVVYETIELAAGDAGLQCARADDIWENDHVMDDVLSLLWRSRVVVADLTGRSANVFYETGLAHALPRPTILLTQEKDDVPFDLRSIRYLKYGVGTQQRATLREHLGARFTTLMNREDC